ncbi:MAG: flagellar hook-basal body complex protein FliE [Oscillospiraceae bacterium]
MDISLLSAAGTANLTDKMGGLLSGASAENGTGFASIFKDALSLAESTESQDKSSTLDLLTGEADDIAGVLIDAQESEIALSLTIQLRNKLMESYNEIMNMQV